MDDEVYRRNGFHGDLSIYWALVSRMGDEAMKGSRSEESRVAFTGLPNFVDRYSWGFRLSVCFHDIFLCSLEKVHASLCWTVATVGV